MDSVSPLQSLRTTPRSNGFICMENMCLYLSFVQGSQTEILNFPSKSWISPFSSHDTDFVNNRRIALNAYLQSLLGMVGAELGNVLAWYIFHHTCYIHLFDLVAVNSLPASWIWKRTISQRKRLHMRLKTTIMRENL